MNASATFTLPKNYIIEAQYNGTSRLYSGNSEVAPRHTLGMVGRKKIMNDKLLLTVAVNNIFDRADCYASNLEAYRSEAQYKNASSGRIWKVTLAWNFNSSKKIKKSKVEMVPASERSRLNEK